ncbi:Transposon Tf2-6 poly [Paramuricea clavata]|uniref:Transposon Tf2-6 poly, partial n=1 Tax=Paramuricea clavata TaxID=317549 RepID=A0A6S7KZQ4_PARCT|nr:Transposon Tf2-6 poly [Paramuricea clavata]
MVRTVKEGLNKILGQAFLNIVELQTVVADISGMINDRPLAKVGAHIKDVVTPSKLFMGRNVGQWPGRFDHLDLKQIKNIKDRWKYRNTILTHYWRRWRTDYLRDQQQRSKWFEKQNNVKIDDIVLLLEDKKNRNDWQMGRVIAIKHSRDGCVRTVTVRTQKGEFVRSIRYLCPIEFAEAPEAMAEDSDSLQPDA